MRTVLLLPFFFLNFFCAKAGIHLESAQKEFIGQSINLYCYSANLEFQPQTLEGCISWAVDTDKPLLMGVGLKRGSCTFWYRPGQELHLQLHRAAPGLPLELLTNQEQLPADKLIGELGKISPTLFGGSTVFGGGIPNMPQGSCETAWKELHQQQAALLEIYQQKYAHFLDATEQRAMEYWLHIAPINNWDKLFPCTAATLFPNAKQDVHNLYESLLTPKRLELLNAPDALEHWQAQLLLMRIFLADTDKARALNRINKWLKGHSAAYVKTKLYCMTCKSNSSDAQQTPFPDSIKAFTANSPNKNWRNQVEKACYPDKNPVLNQPFSFVFEDISGSSVQLPENKVVLIDIWTTWCGPCRKEAKYLPGLVEYFDGKAFEVFALSFDEDRLAWENYIQAHDFPYRHYHIGKQAENMKKELGIYNYPRYLLIDQSGQLVNLQAPRPSEAALKVEIEKLLSPEE